MRHFCIYAIVCPITREIIYVGKSTDYEARKNGHKYNKHKSPISNYIFQLFATGLSPVFIILEDFGFHSPGELNYHRNKAKVFVAEIDWINYYRRLNYILLNVRINYVK